MIVLKANWLVFHQSYETEILWFLRKIMINWFLEMVRRDTRHFFYNSMSIEFNCAI